MSNTLQKVGECLYRNSHGGYFAWFSVRGKQIKRSLKTKDRKLAQRRLAVLREDAGRVHGDSGEQRHMRFEDAEGLWLKSIQGDVKSSTLLRRQQCLNGLRPYFAGKPLRSVGVGEVEKWKIERGARLSARSFNKELETLALLFRYARDVKGLLLDDPAARLKKRRAGKTAVVMPGKGQFRALVAALREEPQAVRSGAADFVEFLAYSGLRLGEALAVRWEDLNFALNTMLVTGGERGTKNHECRAVPLFPALRGLFERMRDAAGGAGHGPVFKLEGKGGVRQALASACARAALPRFTHHSLRHFFCSNAIEAGCDFKVIAEWLGHKDGGVLVAKTYGHLRAEHSVAMARRMTFDASREEPENVLNLASA